MIDPVAIAVDDGLLEAECVDQEADKRPGVVGSQRGPYLRWWCLVSHDLSLSRPAPGWLGYFGTPALATWSARCLPAIGTPGPGEPGRSSRSRPPGQQGRGCRSCWPGAVAAAWPGETAPPWRRPSASARSRSGTDHAGAGRSTRSAVTGRRPARRRPPPAAAAPP